MANTISNELTVYGEHDEVQRFCDDAKNEVEWQDGTKQVFPLSLRKIAPLPDVPDCGPATWRAALRYCWGCNQDIIEFGDVDGGVIKELESGTVRVDFHFYSPWNPPIRALLTASNTFPQLEFHLTYIDRCNWTTGGIVTIKDGRFCDKGYIPQIKYIFDMGREFNRRYGEWSTQDFPEDLANDAKIVDAKSLIDALRSATHFHLLDGEPLFTSRSVPRADVEPLHDDLLEELKNTGQPKEENDNA